MISKQSSIIGVLLLTLSTVQITTRAQSPPAPGPEHERLKELEGTWDAKVKGGDEVTPAVATYKMECGGLWLMSDFRGEMGGVQFQGRSMEGYDPEKKKYVSVWVDSMSVRPLFLEGTYDAAKKTMTMTGEGPGPDGKPAKLKMVTVMPDADHQTFTMYVVGPDAQDMQLLTIDYTRRKSSP